MKKKFKLENLDCANCAQKMEDSINKIEGVNAATISFLTLKLIIDADEENFENILDEAQKRIHKVEADCNILR
ncbi:MAG: heavy-metal-associated domain-containing protein [Clostridiales bacterium]|jgi:cation transport ATPase|nr:heavy-metal-associated domain-containing protein [Clostridiales bacterium]